LTEAHRKTLEASVRQSLASKQAGYASSLRPNWPSGLRVRRVADVAKPKRGEAFTKLQAGVRLAHTVLEQASNADLPTYVTAFDLRSVFHDVFERYEAQRSIQGA